jgi:hypothetical protein
MKSNNNECPNCAIGILVYRTLYTYHKDDVRLDCYRDLNLSSLSISDLIDIWYEISDIISQDK